MERLLLIVCTIMVLFISVPFTTGRYNYYRQDENASPHPTEPPVDSVLATLLLKNCTMCPRLYKPLCASNGKWYHNPCFMACEVGEDPSINILYEGVCRPEHLSTKIGEDATAIPEEVTSELHMEHVPPAQQAPTQEECIQNCPKIYNPVCGTNGQWYHNSCVLNCTVGKYIKVAHLGKCASVLNQIIVENIMSECTMCNKVYDPVCATNGEWYYNVCVMACKLGNDTDVEVQYHGRCIHF